MYKIVHLDEDALSMHMQRQILLLLLLIQSGTSDLTCPDQIEVGSEAAITCVAPDTTDKHGYSTPNREVAAICELQASACQPLAHYTAAVVNDTCSVLTIPRVKISDAGDWRCTVPPSPMLTCHMVVYKLPSCVVISNGMDQTTQVNLTGFYCSQGLHFQVVGSVCKGLTLPVTSITDGSFNCTATQLGSTDTVNVTFTCGKVGRSLKCEEVNHTLTGVRQDTTTALPGERERPGHTSTGIALPVIICIIILIIIIITMVVLYRNRHGFQCFGKQSTHSAVDPGYKSVEKSKPVSL
ncbi:uncharacterized protein LOC124282215 isoform X2 [Haliotis rubra]|uniref:uncharacterized protein LOC124282215 isoform X2 n=1 Tax=Haliotis rubra TaxID=36100 RepID=UPI001EE603A3|nr:uncharacterized protein LOC124282215 isoform X2 [Haliotis rubra]